MNKEVKIFISILAVTTVLSGCGIKETNSFNNNEKSESSTKEYTIDKKLNGSESSIIQLIHEEAMGGKVINCGYKAKDNCIDEVIVEYGEKFTSDIVEAAQGTYFTFEGKDFVFGVNKGMQIFEIRNYSQEVKEIHLKDIVGSLTEDVGYDTLTATGERIIGFKLNEDYKLEFVFKNGSEDNPTVDHYNVLYPKGSSNLMAGIGVREW